MRASGPRLKVLIDTAVASSATFRQLVSDIEATDGIVFVREGRCPRRLVACLEHRVTLAGIYRLLFIGISADRPDIDVMASAGHELKHALEVLENPSLRSNADIVLFYTPGITQSPPRPVDTAAAKAAGDAVFRELRQAAISARNGAEAGPRPGSKFPLEPGLGELRVPHHGVTVPAEP